MDESWVGYEVDVEGNPGIALTNIALGEIEPDAKRPFRAIVRLTFKDAGESGPGDQDERDRFSDFEDALGRALERHGAVHASSIRSGGALDLLYYLPDSARDPLAAAAVRVCKGYSPKVDIKPDPEWVLYQSIFPCEDAISVYHDSQLIAAMAESGDKVEQASARDALPVLRNQSRGGEGGGQGRRQGVCNGRTALRSRGSNEALPAARKDPRGGY